MSKIEDSTSITELRTQISGMKELLGNKTLLTSMGITPLQKMQLSSQVKKFEREFASLFTLPDNFNEAFKDTGITNEDGWIITDTQMRTSVPGVYAVGDVREKELRQVTTAVGDGSIAGQQVFQFIEEQKDLKTTV